MWLSPAAKATTILQQDYDSLSETFPIFLTEFVDIMLQIAKQVDQRIALKLVHVLINTFFKINIFKRSVKILAECEEVFAKTKRKFMKNDEFQRYLMSDSSIKNNGQKTLFVKNLTDMLRK